MPRTKQTKALLPANFCPGLPLAVGYSGGADSTALLSLAHARWPSQVVGLHVNHGLQAAAAAFESHCIAFCAARGIPLIVVRVNAHAKSGQSPEDAARQARWRAVRCAAELAGQQTPRQAAQGVSGPNFDANRFSAHMFWVFNATKSIAFEHIAYAQHADDQAETVLLALSRGAGLGGLAGMPACAQRDGLTLHRPLLQVRSSQIRAWLSAEGVSWIEDPSNQSPAFTRNRIRALAVPALEAALPGFAALAARSAAHVAQAQDLLAELAELDLAAAGVPPKLAELQALSPARQANALRHWLANSCLTQASTVQLAELQKQIAACQTRGHHIELKVGSGTVQRSGAVLTFQPPAPSP